MSVQQTMTFQGSAEERGSWPTGRAIIAALLPLAAFIGIAIAINGRSELLIPSGQIVWLVLVPLGLIHPFVASIARVHAYAPTTILVVASIAPAFALAARLLLEPVPRDAQGRALLTWSEVWDRVLPPAVLAVAVFVAIEITTAGLRRGIVLGLAAAIVGAVIVGGAALGLLLWTAMPIQGPA